jgi:ferritin-like metal-binding protein YciE
MKKITEQRDLFTLKLQTLYDIEKELEKSLPKLGKAATDGELSEGIMLHLEQTKKQAERLEEIFEMLGETPSKNKSEAIRGMVEDTSEMLKTNSSTQLKDVLIASSARDVEHYEIANYMSAILEAQKLGMSDVEDLLQLSLEEEQTAEGELEKSMQKNLEKEEVTASDLF